VTAAIPLRRMGIPQDIAEIVGFLISDRAAWITDSNFIVDGGQNPTV
jgi:NAD(P)-dependent dehydrogenase (short-subunit alcohol dehydrogenase family)